MDFKELRKYYNKVVRYDHKGLDPIYPVLQGIFLHEVNGYEVYSAVLLDSTGTTYQALPAEISDAWEAGCLGGRMPGGIHGERDRQ